MVTLNKVSVKGQDLLTSLCNNLIKIILLRNVYKIQRHSLQGHFRATSQLANEITAAEILAGI